jgi:hypothetical protein
MNDFINQYQFWIEKLGWTTPEMLTALTRGAPRADLPGGRDRVLERFLSKGLKSSKLMFHPFGHTRAYTLVGRKLLRRRNLYHDVMASQALVKLWLPFGNFQRTVLAPSDFFAQQSPVVPDFGLTVSLPNGSHAFALEYQTYTEASRTTALKLADYNIHFAGLKTVMKADAIWALLILERSSEWVQEFSTRSSYPFAYFIDAPKYFETTPITTTPIFFLSGGALVSLVQTP